MITTESTGVKESARPNSALTNLPKRTGSKTSDDENRHVYESACGSSIEINYNETRKPSSATPFLSEWAFGSRPGGKVVNLSYEGRGLIAFPSSHLVVLYDFKSHAQRLLHGHKNAVAALSADSRGLWLASADSGEGKEPTSVIVWDVRRVCAARELPAPASEFGYRLVAMSPDGENVVAVTEPGGRGRPLVHLWHWREESSVGPDSTLELPRALGRANAITFSPDSPRYLMITCDRNVAFLSWDGGQLLQHVAELLAHTRSTGRLLDSTYQSGTPNAVTVTSKGFIIVWTDPPVYSPNSKVSRQVFCVERDGLNAVTEVDRMVVIGTRRGHVRFYDEELNILHWYQQTELDSIACLSFALDTPPDGDVASWVGSRTSFPTVRRSVDVEARGAHTKEDLSRMISGPTPSGPNRDRFLARDLIVSTTNGKLALVSFLNERCVLLQDSQAAITSIAAHTEKSQLLIGRANSTITLIDYVEKEVLVTHTFETRKGFGPIAVTSLKYSPNGLVLACGLADGSLYFLHPELLHPVAPPLRKTYRAVRDLCFSPDSMFMAHGDGANYVSAYRSSDVVRGRWVYLGKKQLHGLPIRNLLFGQTYHQAPLFSLGEDLVLVEYDVAHSLNNTLLVTRVDRVDQSGVARFLTWCPGPTPDSEPLFLLANSEFKFKLVNPATRQVCGTFQGPTLLTPVNIIKTMKGPNAQAPACAVFSTTRRLGLQILPPDGNPFKNMALMAHPIKVMSFVMSACLKYVFTSGTQDQTVFMWRVNQEAMTAMLSEGAGGAGGLEPWLLSLQGGRDGWLYKEMEEAFCYAQIIHQGTHSDQPRQIGDHLPLCELPDLMRSLGYFPSQYEINNMVSEVQKRSGDTLSFSDFVKLYVNHKPVHGISVEQLWEAFNVFGYPVSQKESVMTKEKFLALLLDKGEALDMAEAQGVLQVLLHGESASDSDTYTHLLMDELTRREKLFHYLPETITFSYLMETLLGAGVRK